MSSNWEKLQRKQNRPTTARVLSVRVVNTNKSGKSARVPLTKLAQQQKQQKQQQRQQEHQQQQEERNFQNAHPCTKKTAEGKKNEVGKYIAMDCEFVGVGPNGIQSELARVSIVNFHGNTIYDQYVQPREKVTDWRTFVSGIRPSDMANAISFAQAQKEVSDLLKDRILVGHAIHHDLEALYLTHPKRDIRDTSRHTPFKQKYSKGKTPSLKKLAAEILKKDIQGGEHSSVEDARATMLIYKSDRKNFEANYAKFNPRYN